MPVCYAGGHAAVIKVYDRAVIAHFPIFQEQVCEIRAPLTVCTFGGEILLQSVFKHFVGLPGLCPRLFGTDDGTQPHLHVHVFMDSCGTVAVSYALQIGRHAAVAVNAVVPVVDLIYLSLDFCFLGIITRLPVFTVVIVGIRADPQPPEQPAGAEFFMVLVDNPVSL